MHIAAILRIVPDQNEDLEIDDSGADIDREWIGLKLNEFDDQALEEAVLLKEAAGARVTAVALAGDGAERQLQTAIARGADDALLVDHDIDGIPGARAAAHLLAGPLRDLGADLVLTGVQTPEDVFGQLAPFLAGLLGWPVLNAVHGVGAGAGGLEVVQEYSGGRAARFAVTGPAVLGVQTASRPPRYVSGSKLRQASSATIARAAGALPDGFAAPRIAALAEPARSNRAEMLDGDAEAVAERLAGLLAERGLLGGRE